MTVKPTSAAGTESMKPPASQVGVLGWIRKNLFSGVFNSILTLLVLYLLWKIVPVLVNWALLKSSWVASAEECRELDGACWSIIPANLRFIIFGFFPASEQWRPLLAMVVLVLLLFYSQNRQHWKRSLASLWGVGLLVMAVLMKGGLFGLSAVESSQWSGLPLTLMLSVFGLAAAYPLGVVLALGRQSKMPVIKSFSVIYIELIRGVPLISMLFMSSVVFPLFLPEGLTVNNILRAQVAIILFTAAYVAEVVRGGLQGIAQGQYEAAESLGLNYFQTMRLIVLPQALKIVIPPTVSVLITAFKDTSLVVIIALFDLLRTSQTVLSEPKWMGFSAEMYVFVALIYFVCCFFMSNYSRRLERELDTGL
ncbi:MAG: amino acid ABC transporter permease [Desulfobulbus propionicus]|nr:MAG: amino acid ABC transporter permease [Desulfobulbus propionicus]